MLRVRVIPSLLLRHESLVKTRRFGDFTYVGDPANTVRIFNELEVDELFFLDIVASKEGRGPNLRILRNIADECFMPLGYGGGIGSFDNAKSVFDIGFEKISLNTTAVEKPELITQLANHYGSQAVVVSIDVKAGPLGKTTVRTRAGENNTHLEPVAWAKEVERRGAGEILLTSIDREGSWSGFDLDLILAVSSAVSIPVIAHGGAGTVDHIGQAVHQAGASAVALGSMVVFQKKDMGVLVNYPNQDALRRVL
ncbi:MULTISPECIES: AglZ/HisF2 family acetamidino modification protein [unclassified Agrobacterium]|uniref:AglZ/HisF2 family acetamidino modification protein n=1 Tax=unclassified Agrobacterium TaxID=2632611 RepID=UPI00083CF097|nr:MULTISPECIES: AglZ/HisF2 family acetamidino modification protein [unclassified Agrobacterium]AOG12511.1 dihydrouridine synthase family protein [Agrobacterium sp. RAC06]QGG93505.1 imidazole glycerol phosphate synthase subunit HisF [Agrobacterium sp. MA01]